MGRPPAEKPKIKFIKARVTVEEFETVMEYASKHSMTLSEMILGAIKKCYPKCFK